MTLQVQNSTHKLLVSLCRLWWREDLIKRGSHHDAPISASELAELTTTLQAQVLTKFSDWQRSAHMYGNAAILPDIEHPFHGRILKSMARMSVPELHHELFTMLGHAKEKSQFEVQLGDWIYTWSLLLSRDTCDYDSTQTPHELTRFQYALILAARLDANSIGSRCHKAERKAAKKLIKQQRESLAYYGPDGMKAAVDAILAAVPREDKVPNVYLDGRGEVWEIRPTLTDDQWAALEQYLWGALYDRRPAA